MNTDHEFFRIVSELGPMGQLTLESYEPHPAAGTYARPTEGCCDPDEGSICCSVPQAEASSRVSGFPGLAPRLAGQPDAGGPVASAGGGPSDPRVTPYPKWDPATRAWWVWDESAGAWTRGA